MNIKLFDEFFRQLQDQGIKIDVLKITDISNSVKLINGLRKVIIRKK